MTYYVTRHTRGGWPFRYTVWDDDPRSLRYARAVTVTITRRGAMLAIWRDKRAGGRPAKGYDVIEVVE